MKGHDRTTVILVVIATMVMMMGKWRDPRSLPFRSSLFLVLSGLATGASWLCYFRALQVREASPVAPSDKLSVVLVAIFAVLFLGERPALRDWPGITFGRRRRRRINAQAIGATSLVRRWARGHHD